MKGITILVLVLTIGSVFCALDNKNQGVFKSMHDAMSKSDLGRALIGMVEMTSELGGSDLKPLYQALKSLKDNILKQKEAEDLSYSSDGETHSKEVDRLTGLIALYANQITVATEDLQNLVLGGQQLQLDLDNQNMQLQTAQNAKATEETTIAKLETNYNTETQSFQDAIELLDKALAKLIDAQAGADNTAFIQTSAQEFDNIASLLEAKITKITSTIYLAPVLEVFAQFSKKQAISSDSIQKAFSALNDLKAYFEQGLTELGIQYKSEREKHEKLLLTLKVQIGTLTATVIPKTKSDIEANQASQTAKNGELNDAQSNKRQAEKNLADENTSFDQRTQSHNLLMPEYDEEYAVVAKAEQIIRNNNPNAFVEIDDDDE